LVRGSFSAILSGETVAANRSVFAVAKSNDVILRWVNFKLSRPVIGSAERCFVGENNEVYTQTAECDYNLISTLFK
jgi:hypothetical protein